MIRVTAEVYEVLALAFRYVFALLGVLIVLRSFLSLSADRREKHARLRRLPDAGMIGEFVVLSGSPECPEESFLSVPREGVLGSVRSCDLVVPCPGVKARHLDFTWQDGVGLLLRPRSGCEALADSVPLNCRSHPESAPLRHGSFLQVGDAVLRLRVFAGLDSAAGFDSENEAQTPVQATVQIPPQATMQMPPQMPEGMPTGAVSPVPPPPYPNPGMRQMPRTPYDPGPAGMPVNPPQQAEQKPAAGPRRERHWKEDWSD